MTCRRRLVAALLLGPIVPALPAAALLEAKLGHVDPTGDFDGDGAVTAQTSRCCEPTWDTYAR